jgi:hypothetical protein
MRWMRLPISFVFVCVGSMAGCGTVHRGPARQATSGVATHSVAASQRSLNADGTSSTPGVFVVPQMGFVGFRCDRAWRVQPFFDLHYVAATEEVSIRAGNLIRRNFTRRLVGHTHGRPLWLARVSPAQRIALPFAHYHSVVFTLHQGTEARILDARVIALFVARVVTTKGTPPLAACLVKHWSVSMSVS